MALRKPRRGRNKQRFFKWKKPPFSINLISPRYPLLNIFYNKPVALAFSGVFKQKRGFPDLESLFFLSK
jgi:hypothetical protein